MRHDTLVDVCSVKWKKKENLEDLGFEVREILMWILNYAFTYGTDIIYFTLLFLLRL